MGKLSKLAFFFLEVFHFWWDTIPKGWWKRKPFLPVCDMNWIYWRLETAYGYERVHPLSKEVLKRLPQDIYYFLLWRRKMRRR